MKDIRNAEVPARDRAVCANALDRILERKRILRMRPAPKPVDASEYEKRQKKRKLGGLPDSPELVETSPQTPPAGTPVRRLCAVGASVSAIDELVRKELLLSEGKDGPYSLNSKHKQEIDRIANVMVSKQTKLG
jgi:hypothetical protein